MQMEKLLSWREVFDANKLFDYPLREAMKRECAEVTRRVRYQFMAFNDEVYFVGYGRMEYFCHVNELEG